MSYLSIYVPVVQLRVNAFLRALQGFLAQLEAVILPFNELLV